MTKRKKQTKLDKEMEKRDGEQDGASESNESNGKKVILRVC